jgi:hypothetical protein
MTFLHTFLIKLQGLGGIIKHSEIIHNAAEGFLRIQAVGTANGLQAACGLSATCPDTWSGEWVRQNRLATWR